MGAAETRPESRAESRVVALVPAAGHGTRAGGERNKALTLLDGEPMILHGVRVLHDHPRVEQVCVAVTAAEESAFGEIFGDRQRWPRVRCLPVGGPERQDTVRAALEALQDDPPALVMVHDGARPCLPAELIDRVLDALPGAEGIVPVMPIVDTVREIGDAGTRVVARENLRRCQTPQAFVFAKLIDAHRRALREGLAVTDDGQLIEACGGLMKTVPGARRNLKVTTADDFDLATWLLARGHWGC